ncbi:MAG: hypothetical protein K6A80_04595 [Saccharofermentans sp.]|nr:hypothetical protein [Saccharofermentans sp.]
MLLVTKNAITNQFISNSGCVMTSDQYNWFRNNYSLTLPSGYVTADTVTLSGGLVSSADRIYYRNDKGVTDVSSSSNNNATISVNDVRNNGYLVANFLEGYYNGKVDYSQSDLSRLCSTYGITLK